MSSKLDQSLEDILSTRRKTAGRRGRGRRVPNGTRVTTAAPSGGIQKSAKGAKATTKAAVPSGPAAGSGDSKIIVSNLVSKPISWTVQHVLTSLAFRCQRGPDQGMLNLRPSTSWTCLDDPSMKSILRSNSSIRGATTFPFPVRQ